MPPSRFDQIEQLEAPLVRRAFLIYACICSLILAVMVAISLAMRFELNDYSASGHTRRDFWQSLQDYTNLKQDYFSNISALFFRPYLDADRQIAKIFY